jgi:hypothetical protein
LSSYGFTGIRHAGKARLVLGPVTRNISSRAHSFGENTSPSRWPGESVVGLGFAHDASARRPHAGKPHAIFDLFLVENSEPYLDKTGKMQGF